MKRTTKMIISIMVVAIIIGGVWFYLTRGSNIIFIPSSQAGTKIDEKDIERGIIYLKTDSLPPEYHSEKTVTVAKLKNGELRASVTVENYDKILSNKNYRISEQDFEKLMNLGTKLKDSKDNGKTGGEPEYILVYENSKRIVSFGTLDDTDPINALKAQTIFKILRNR